MKKYLLLGFVVLAVIGSDQWTKWWAVAHLHRPVKKCPFRQCNDVARGCRRQCRKTAVKKLRGTKPVRGRTSRGKVDPKKQKQTAAERKIARAKAKLCKGACKKAQKACKAKHKDKQAACSKAYKKRYGAWQARVKAMKKSWLCREVKQGWAGAKPTCVVVRGFFHFNYQTNTGAAWGMFGNYPRSFRRPFFIVITLLAILFIFYLFLFRLEPDERFMGLALALILGGALGNFADRIRMDYVVDFIQWFVHYGKGKVYYWPTFNIADVAITVGVALIAIELFFFTPFEEEEDASDETGAELAVASGAAGVPAAMQVESDRIPVAVGLQETIHETGERDSVEPDSIEISTSPPAMVGDVVASFEDIPVVAELWDAPSTTQTKRVVGTSSIAGTVSTPGDSTDYFPAVEVMKKTNDSFPLVKTVRAEEGEGASSSVTSVQVSDPFESASLFDRDELPSIPMEAESVDSLFAKSAEFEETVEPTSYSFAVEEKKSEPVSLIPSPFESGSVRTIQTDSFLKEDLPAEPAGEEPKVVRESGADWSFLQEQERGDDAQTEGASEEGAEETVSAEAEDTALPPDSEESEPETIASGSTDLLEELFGGGEMSLDLDGDLDLAFEELTSSQQELAAKSDQSLETSDSLELEPLLTHEDLPAGFPGERLQEVEGDTLLTSGENSGESASGMLLAEGREGEILSPGAGKVDHDLELEQKETEEVPTYSSVEELPVAPLESVVELSAADGPAKQDAGADEEEEELPVAPLESVVELSSVDGPAEEEDGTAEEKDAPAEEEDGPAEEEDGPAEEKDETAEEDADPEHS